MPAACRYPGAAGSHRGRRAVRLCGQGAGVPCPRGDHGRAGARGLVTPATVKLAQLDGELVLGVTRRTLPRVLPAPWPPRRAPVRRRVGARCGTRRRCSPPGFPKGAVPTVCVAAMR